MSILPLHHQGWQFLGTYTISPSPPMQIQDLSRPNHSTVKSSHLRSEFPSHVLNLSWLSTSYFLWTKSWQRCVRSCSNRIAHSVWASSSCISLTHQSHYSPYWFLHSSWLYHTWLRAWLYGNYNEVNQLLLISVSYINETYRLHGRFDYEKCDTIFAPEVHSKGLWTQMHKLKLGYKPHRGVKRMKHAFIFTWCECLNAAALVETCTRSSM